jgi:hypothetical protein
MYKYVFRATPNEETSMKYLLTVFITFLLFINCVFSQVNFTGYMVNKDNKKLRDVKINLYEGNEMLSSKKWSKKFDYNLKLETYYTLELEKNGFISKKIAISTFEGDKGAEPFMFIMELVEEIDVKNSIDSDFPSALIEYKKDEGSFDFDEKYAKDLKRKQKEALKKQKKKGQG